MEIAALAKDLMEALDQEPDLREINHDPDFLPRLVELATDLAANPPLSNPVGRAALRYRVFCFQFLRLSGSGSTIEVFPDFSCCL
jgi:hypothetical protein